MEAWFEGNEENIQAFLIEMTRKLINIPKVMVFFYMKHQKLKTFLELSTKIFPDLVKVFFINLQLKNDVLLSSVKGV